MASESDQRSEALNEFGDQLLRQLRGGSGGGGGGFGGGGFGGFGGGWIGSSGGGYSGGSGGMSMSGVMIMSIVFAIGKCFYIVYETMYTYCCSYRRSNHSHLSMLCSLLLNSRSSNPLLLYRRVR